MTDMATAVATGTISKDFLLAGRAVFTVANPKGERYTFKVTRKDPEVPADRPVTGRERKAQPTYFVALLTGPDNESDYTYMGVLSLAVGTVILTKASKFKTDSTPFRVAQHFIARIWNGQPIPAGYGVHHEGKCGRCGRALTVPESILTGLGPDCMKIMGLGLVTTAPPVIDLGDRWQAEDSVDRAERALGVQ